MQGTQPATSSVSMEPPSKRIRTDAASSQATQPSAPPLTPVWSPTYQGGHQLALASGECTRLWDTLLSQGYVSIKLDDGTRQQLENYSSAARERLSSPGSSVKQLPGKSYLELTEETAVQSPSQAANQVLTTLRSIALSVLHALCSAPDSPAQYQGFCDLLSSHPPSSLLHVNKYHKGPQASTCPCHDWHVDRGLLTVVWSKGPGLQVQQGRSPPASPPHLWGDVVTVFPGYTLQWAMNHELPATQHRAAYTAMERVSLAFKLQARPDATIDLARLTKPVSDNPAPLNPQRRRPVTVQQLYLHLSGSIHSVGNARAPGAGADEGGSSSQPPAANTTRVTAAAACRPAAPVTDIRSVQGLLAPTRPENAAVLAIKTAAAGERVKLEQTGMEEQPAAAGEAVPPAAVKTEAAGASSEPGGAVNGVIHIIIRSQSGEEVMVKVKTSTRFEKIYKAYCDSQGLEAAEVQFTHNSKALPFQGCPADIPWQAEEVDSEQYVVVDVRPAVAPQEGMTGAPASAPWLPSVTETGSAAQRGAAGARQRQAAGAGCIGHQGEADGVTAVRESGEGQGGATGDGGDRDGDTHPQRGMDWDTITIYMQDASGEHREHFPVQLDKPLQGLMDIYCTLALGLNHWVFAPGVRGRGRDRRSVQFYLGDVRLQGSGTPRDYGMEEGATVVCCVGEEQWGQAGGATVEGTSQACRGNNMRAAGEELGVTSSRWPAPAHGAGDPPSAECRSGSTGEQPTGHPGQAGLAVGAVTAQLAVAHPPSVAAAEPDLAQPGRRSEQPEAEPRINIVFNNMEGHQVWFKVKMSARFGKVFDLYCERVCVARDTLRFVWNGTRLHEEDTPGRIGSGRYASEMEDNDTVDVVPHQCGD